ncbi:MAG: CvpA family protein [Eubacterium sp.]|nr:CvpA family protein [Eubacterium sp.]
MKKAVKKIVIAIILVLFFGIYYYITIPAINIHSGGFWQCLLFLTALLTAVYVMTKAGRVYKEQNSRPELKSLMQEFKLVKIGVVAFILIGAVYAVGAILSSPIVNAAKYQKLLTVEESDFVRDIKEVSFNTIPLLDKSSAELLGNRKMGSMVDMVSQFEVSTEYTQINYQNTPVRVAPLVYASPIKWLTNQKQGIPAYIRIDMATQNTECVKLQAGIRYSESELFNRNIYRHLRFHYPTYIFGDQIFFEINDEGTPYWVCPVKKFNIGLFGGQTVGKAILCNAITGECEEYDVEDVPTWVDKVYSAELLTGLYNYYGILKHGYFNSILGQKDCLQTTNGYNYIALNDDVWVYTGVTSVSGDQSNVGFVLMNQRTMETKFYRIEGAIEDSAMSSAEGQVQNLGYRATFPLLLNITNEPTYFMALKDGAGLVKKYAMVNVQKYQWVAIGDTVQECERAYMKLLTTNGITKSQVSGVYEKKKGKIASIAPVVVDGNTHYYICLEQSEDIFDVNVADTTLVKIVKYTVGDMVSFEYEMAENGIFTVVNIE